MSKRKSISAFSLSALLLGTLVSCGSSIPDYQEVDRSANYISNDNYRNFYHLWMDSFADSNADGIGDFKGITENLDYLRSKNREDKKSLGVDGIFLSPFNEAVSYHKYDITDYYKVDNDFGTNEDLKSFIKESHDRGIKVIMDLVVNHTSSSHPWFTEAKEGAKACYSFDRNGVPSTSCLEATPKLDWYRFIKKGNSLPDYSNAMQTDSELPNLQYEGFASGMADLNLDNPDVRKEIIKICKFYIDLGMDGFRLDTVENYYTKNVSKNAEFVNWLNAEVKKLKADAYIVGEGPWSSNSTEYTEKTDIESYFDFTSSINGGRAPFIPGLLGRETVSPQGYGKSIIQYSSSLDNLNPRITPIQATFVANHDIGRSANSFKLGDGSLDSDAYKLNYALSALISGNFFLYYGEEIGQLGGFASDLEKREALNWGKGDKRIATDFVLKKPDGSLKFEQRLEPVTEQIKDEDSVFNYMRNLFRIKDFHPEIARGTTSLAGSNDSIFVLKKSYNGKDVYILCNTTKKASSIEKSIYKGETLELQNGLSINSSYPKDKKTSIEMPAYSIAIVR